MGDYRQEIKMRFGDPEFTRKVREEAKRRFRAVALAETPASVQYIQVRQSLTGWAAWDGKKMCVPRPITRKALCIFLHECAHIHLGHNGHSGLPRHVEELQAEKWAFERMRAHGIPVPRTMTKRAKAHISYAIGKALRRGAKRIDSEARRFALSSRRRS